MESISTTPTHDSAKGAAKYLECHGLRLRPVEPADADAMWQVESDSTQWVQNSMAAPFSRSSIAQYAASYDADPFAAGQLRLMVEDTRTGAIAGIADLYEISAQHRNAMVGIYIRPEMRRQGLALQSLALLESYARDLLNLRVLGARIMEGNDASHPLFERAGYRRTGELPGWLQSGSRELSLYLYTRRLG